MKVLITGGNGFIGKNLTARLEEIDGMEVAVFSSGDPLSSLDERIRDANVVFHLAGVNRPDNDSAFDEVNSGLTKYLCDLIRSLQLETAIIFSSSSQAARDNPYGKSKLAAENCLAEYSEVTGNTVTVFRLPNVFGKWCRPDYNSVVATFCHRIARGLDIDVHDPDALLNLVYIDDVVDAFLSAMQLNHNGLSFQEVNPQYQATVGEVAGLLREFGESRQTLMPGKVGTGLCRALYATYLSYQKPDNFSYSLESHEDARGKFVEFLKTPDCGQFSFLTAKPGVTRGGHYHHTKNEKFLVLQGQARFKFRHIATEETTSLEVSAKMPEVVETIPGWAHDITNIGNEELIVMLWANEIFDHEVPDTIKADVDE